MEDAFCCICNDKAYDVVLEMRDKVANYRKVCCKGCGYVYANPRMTSEETKVFYSRDYTTTYIKRHKKSSAERLAWELYHSARQFDAIRRHVPLREGMRVLDAGCAFGSLLAIFKEFGCDVVGTEPGEEYRAYHRDLYDLAVECDLFENVHSRFRDYDLVLLSYTLEHVREPLDFLRKVGEALRANGIVYISVPNLFKPPHHATAPLAASHFQAFSVRSLHNLLCKAGLIPVTIDDTTIPGTILFLATKQNGEAPTFEFIDTHADVMCTLQAYQTLEHIMTMRDRHAAETMLQRSPEFSDFLYFILAAVHYGRDSAKSEDYLLKTIAAKRVSRTKEPLNWSLADAHFILGRLLHQQGRYQEAAGELAAAERLYPQLHTFSFLRAVRSYVSFPRDLQKGQLYYLRLFPLLRQTHLKLGLQDKAEEALKKTGWLGISCQDGPRRQTH